MGKNRKKNRQDNIMLIILILILIVCFSIFGVLFYKYFYAGTSSSKYGNRLDGIENYKLSETLEDDINSLYTKESSVSTVTVNVEGKIIYIDIDFKESIKTDKAQTLAVKALDKIGKENLTFYEIHFVLTYSGKEKNSNYPLFGMKNASSSKVVW